MSVESDVAEIARVIVSGFFGLVGFAYVATLAYRALSSHVRKG